MERKAVRKTAVCKLLPKRRDGIANCPEINHRHPLPDIPARRVQFQVSAGLLTDGSSSLSAFPGAKPSDIVREQTRRLQLRGQFRLHPCRMPRIPFSFLSETGTVSLYRSPADFKANKLRFNDRRNAGRSQTRYIPLKHPAELIPHSAVRSPATAASIARRQRTSG